MKVNKKIEKQLQETMMSNGNHFIRFTLQVTVFDLFSHLINSNNNE